MLGVDDCEVGVVAFEGSEEGGGDGLMRRDRESRRRVEVLYDCL